MIGTAREAAAVAGRNAGTARAAEYVRMSTEHQRYSIENQSRAIREFASRHGMRVVRSYRDAGKSGLNLGGRPGLQALLSDVQHGRADFASVLVYDVSRWGRFQNTDEAAYYEFLCTRAGIQVIYCAEWFVNDGSPMAAIAKSMRRAMAGEYSRELSVKVWIGKCRLIELGFRQGGICGYGLRRQLIDAGGNVRGVLQPGERKSIQTDRVRLIPGPPEEVQVIRGIFDTFLAEQVGEAEIARRLNAAAAGAAWTREQVAGVLKNEKYIGNNIFNRTSVKLRQKPVHNPPEQWIRHDGAFDGIVPLEVFQRTQEKLDQRAREPTEEELLELLRPLLQREGRLTSDMITAEPGIPNSAYYVKRFGTLAKVYERVGYRPPLGFLHLRTKEALRRIKPLIWADILAGFATAGAEVAGDERKGLLTVERAWTVQVVVAHCEIEPGGTNRWYPRLDRRRLADVVAIVRLAEGNEAVRDYYLVPGMDYSDMPAKLHEHNGARAEAFRADSLERLYALAVRSDLRRVRR
ncbi:MAG: recombinase family protein [Nevskia sp.]|nr:recombinase family protein [Nevskia sp.]